MFVFSKVKENFRPSHFNAIFKDFTKLFRAQNRTSISKVIQPIFRILRPFTVQFGLKIDLFYGRIRAQIQPKPFPKLSASKSRPFSVQFGHNFDLFHGRIRAQIQPKPFTSFQLQFRSILRPFTKTFPKAITVKFGAQIRSESLQIRSVLNGSYLHESRISFATI
jgi:energy-converting hydrogenase Eha subunit F